MELGIVRDYFDDVCTQGQITVDNAFFGYTLEPRVDQGHGKPYAIPCGRYRVLLGMSPHFGRVVPMLQDVPGFANVEIHMGNKAADTHGCTLIGKVRSKDWISQSVVALYALVAKMQALTKGEEIWATYSNKVA